jgi:hypothetical protein
MMQARTDDLVELLALVQDERVDLSVRRLVLEVLVLAQGEPGGPWRTTATYLLRFGKLLDRRVHPCLNDGDLLVLLFPQPLQFVARAVQLLEEIVDLDLLCLHTTCQHSPLTTRSMSLPAANPRAH